MAATSIIYDLFCPSPPPLKETASMAVALEVWRTKTREQGIDNILASTYFGGAGLSSSDQLPNSPTRVVHNVDKYLRIMTASISDWMSEEGAKAGFSKVDLLASFDDFVCDFNGTIDAVRTAQRVINCDKISLLVRFKIACVYCLEEDILRMWPEVALIEELKNELDSGKLREQVRYWVCRLRNQLYKFNYSTGRSFRMEDAFYTFVYKGSSWSTLKFFFNCQNLETRLKVFVKKLPDCWKIICRHLLVVFNDEEIEKLVDEIGDKIVYQTILEGGYCTRLIWSHLKSKMNSDVFKRLIQSILTKGYVEYNSGCDDNFLAQIWKTAPDFLKNAIVSDTLTENSLSLKLNMRRFRLLEAMLSDASTEDRKTFWNNQWTKLIDMVDTKNMANVMKLCLNDDCEINEFKQRNLPIQPRVALPRCVQLITNANFSELLALSKYWGFNEETMTGTRSNLLRIGVPTNTRLLNEFIDYSYNGDTTLANEFKTQLLLCRATWTKFSHYLQDFKSLYHHSFWLVMNVVDTLGPSQDIIKHVKKAYIVPIVKQTVRQNAFSIHFAYHLPVFMKWSFETDDELADYKKTLNADRIIQGMIRRQIRDYRKYSSRRVDDCGALGCHIRMPHTSDYFLEDFLRWLVGSGEAFEELKNRYKDDDVFVKMMKVSKNN